MMLTHRSRVRELLASTPLFQRLDEQELTRIAQHSRQVRAPRGAILFNRGDRAEGMHLVVFGQVKLFFTSLRGDEKVLDVLQPGQSFGEAVMFAHQAYPVSAQALVDTLILFISGDAVAVELERDPRLAGRVIAGLCRQVNALIADVQAHSMCSAAQRVTEYLLRGCVDPQARSFNIDLPTSKAIIASQLNIKQEHFSRILNQLTTRGLIAVQGRTIRVVDASKLRDGVHVEMEGKPRAPAHQHSETMIS